MSRARITFGVGLSLVVAGFLIPLIGYFHALGWPEARTPLLVFLGLMALMGIGAALMWSVDPFNPRNRTDDEDDE